jgi:hypothetical protein
VLEETSGSPHALEILKILLDLGDNPDALEVLQETADNADALDVLEEVKTLDADSGRAISSDTHYLEVHTEGAHYEIGDMFHIGVGVEGWAIPATLKVTSIGDGGALADLDIVEEGKYTGDGEPEGNYHLSSIGADGESDTSDSATTSATALLLRASSRGEKYTTKAYADNSKNSKRAEFVGDDTRSLVVVGGAVGACLLALVGVTALIAKRRAAVAKECRELPSVHGVAVAVALTPVPDVAAL